MALWGITFILIQTESLYCEFRWTECDILLGCFCWDFSWPALLFAFCKSSGSQAKTPVHLTFPIYEMKH